MSMPSVLPSAENEWQLAHIGCPSITTLPEVSATLRSRHCTSGTALGASGWMIPGSTSEGINGTSR
jgi:hypothetical protein